MTLVGDHLAHNLLTHRRGSQTLECFSGGGVAQRIDQANSCHNADSALFHCAGDMMRSTGFPLTFCSGKYTRCDSGSTVTVCAFSASLASPSLASDLPSSLNTETTPLSAATYRRLRPASNASTSGSLPTAADEITFFSFMSNVRSFALSSHAMNATRCVGAI